MKSKFNPNRLAITASIGAAIAFTQYIIYKLIDIYYFKEVDLLDLNKHKQFSISLFMIRYLKVLFFVVLGVFALVWISAKIYIFLGKFKVFHKKH